MKPKLLIVTDEIATTQQLFWTLCDDYDVMTASDLLSATRRAIIHEPAILILCAPPARELPDVDLGFLEFIKGRFPHIKTLVISAAGAEAMLPHASLAQVGDEVLEAPFETDRLHSILALLSSEAMPLPGTGSIGGVVAKGAQALLSR